MFGISQETGLMGLSCSEKKFDAIFSQFDTADKCDGQTHRQMDRMAVANTGIMLALQHIVKVVETKLMT